MFRTSPKLTSGPRITSPGRAFYVQVAVPMRLPDAGRLIGSNLPQADFGPPSCRQTMDPHP